jgi:hypothetical protein
MGVEEKCETCLVLPCCRTKHHISCTIFAEGKVNFDNLSRIMERKIHSVGYPSELRRKRDKDKEIEKLLSSYTSTFKIVGP